MKIVAHFAMIASYGDSLQYLIFNCCIFAYILCHILAELCEAALQAMCDCNRSSEALVVLRKCKSRYFKVTARHFNDIFAVCARLGQADQAEQVSTVHVQVGTVHNEARALMQSKQVVTE
jgi:hypothetical protein